MLEGIFLQSTRKMYICSRGEWGPISAIKRTLRPHTVTFPFDNQTCNSSQVFLLTRLPPCFCSIGPETYEETARYTTDKIVQNVKTHCQLIATQFLEDLLQRSQDTIMHSKYYLLPAHLFLLQICQFYRIKACNFFTFGR